MNGDLAGCTCMTSHFPWLVNLFKWDIHENSTTFTGFEIVL